VVGAAVALGGHGHYVAELAAAPGVERRPDLIWLPHEDHTQMLRDILGSVTRGLPPRGKND